MTTGQPIELEIVSPAEIAAIEQARAGFDYGSLADGERAHVVAERDKIRALFARSHQNIIEIGDALINVRDTIGHGNFTRWLDEEFSWSKATAGRFMQVVERFREITHVERFETSALYALAANNVPDEVRDQFIAQAETGQNVRLHDVREVLSQERPRPAPDPVARLVGSLVRAHDDHMPNVRAIRREIDCYDDASRADVAAALAAIGGVLIDASTPYLEGR